jgi:hypothetical protein
MLVEGGTPWTPFSIPSITPMLSTLVAHPYIFSYLSSSGSTPFVPFRGRGILRRCLLVPSLRLRTRTLTLICSKRFVRFVEANWMILALSISSVMKLLSTNRPLAPSPATNSSSSLLLVISGSPWNGSSLTVLFGARNTPMFCDDPSAPLQSFASLKRMTIASTNRGYVCSLLCLLPKPTLRRLPNRHTFGLTVTTASL